VPDVQHESLVNAALPVSTGQGRSSKKSQAQGQKGMNPILVMVRKNNKWNNVAKMIQFEIGRGRGRRVRPRSRVRCGRQIAAQARRVETHECRSEGSWDGAFTALHPLIINGNVSFNIMYRVRVMTKRQVNHLVM